MLGEHLHLLQSGEPPLMFEDGNWSWVILDGGGNDVNDECECGSCLDTLDSMISKDAASGEWVDFIEEILDTSARVALMSYYRMPDDAEFGFHRCNDEVEELRQRYQALSSRHPKVLVVDTAKVVSPETTPESYDED